MTSRSALFVLGFAAAAVASACGQESRVGVDSRPRVDSAQALADADARWTEAIAAEDAGKPGMIVRAAYADAAGLYARAAEAAAGDGPTTARARLGEGWASARAGRPDGALEAFKRAKAAAPDDLEADLAAVRVVLDEGRLDDARARIAAASAASAEAIDSGFTLLEIELLLISGERAALVNLFDRRVSALDDAARAEAWRLVATRLRDVIGDDTLSRLLDAAEAKAPADPLPAFWRGDWALRRRRNAEALAAFKRYRAGRPDDALGALCVCLAATRSGLLDEARSALKDAAATDAERDTFLLAARELTTAFNGEKKYDVAAATQAMVVERSADPEDALNLGVLLLDSGRRDEAAARYRQTLAREDLPAYVRAKAWNYLGLLLHGAGRAAEAEAAFRRSFEAWEGERDARENLGVLLLESGRAAEAEPLFRACIAAEAGRKRSEYHLLRITSGEFGRGAGR
jgi:tetratricopeptide (TPR) repeat protein